MRQQASCLWTSSFRTSYIWSCHKDKTYIFIRADRADRAYNSSDCVLFSSPGELMWRRAVNHLHFTWCFLRYDVSFASRGLQKLVGASCEGARSGEASAHTHTHTNTHTHTHTHTQILTYACIIKGARAHTPAPTPTATVCWMMDGGLCDGRLCGRSSRRRQSQNYWTELNWHRTLKVLRVSFRLINFGGYSPRLAYRCAPKWP